ncbi:hypothetical protein [Vibrio alginolyticus]|uniref:hypothetical protein n=1 Tax=Vibrio alginolyticus TaxID=663 RepID=UPI0006CAA5E8|nr:hypothetical protein [Vibrio alginolyticus]KPM97535.1 hypothetical protein AOG25_13770 [Vibrio alginolyticus]CAH7194891.1 conserved hypothetical protein [Vibrio chagasii]CAH7362622.1 conserved hypothetical protein [Vibrio chagasii]
MSCFRNTFEYQIDVEFIDSNKAKLMFIDSDWKDIFYEFSDLEEVSEHLARNFHNANETLSDGLCRYVEGFGDFKYDANSSTWLIISKDGLTENQLECGGIRIKYEMKPQCSSTQKIE